MGSLNVENLLREVRPDAPCGEDVTYDPVYLEVERLAQGTPERQAGDKILPAEEPNWAALRDACLELTGRTRHLRVILHLAMAAVKLEGLPGLRDALAVLRGVLEQYWEPVYPRLDPDDNNDPLERMNIIGSLCLLGEGDGGPMVRAVREAPLTRSRQFGSFCLRDVMVARGELVLPAESTLPRPDPSVMDGAFADTAVEELSKVDEAAGQIVDHLKGIDQVITERVGAGKAVSFDALSKTVGDIRKCLQGYLAKRGYGAAPAAEAGEAGAPAGSAQGGPAVPGQVNTRDDVLLTLERVCAYYERNEPASPVPLLLRRAQRLVRKSFLEVIRDLMPESVKSMEILGGVESSPSAGEQLPQ